MTLRTIIAITLFVFCQAGYAATFNDLPSFLAATSNITLINFDTGPGGPLTPGQSLFGVYSSIGVDFREASYVLTPVGPVSPPLGWFDDGFVNGKPYFPLWFNANAGPVTAVGIWNVLNSGPIVTLIARDAAGNIIGTVESDAIVANKDFFGLTTEIPIASVEFFWSEVYGWGLDDLYFGQANGAIPEPSTLALLAIGLPALFLLRRRR